jgi:hypothetical protein
LKLTPDQIAAAEACGCTFLPATAEQVQRLAMQRRVFWLDDQPILVRRGSTPFETHGTLLALIADWQPSARDGGADLLPSSATGTAVQAEPDASLLPSHPEAEKSTRGGDGAPVRRRRAGKVPPSSPPPSAEVAQITGSAPHSVEDEMLAEVKEAAGNGSSARVISRRRAGQRPAPRWMTAGKARRGRLKE